MITVRYDHQFGYSAAGRHGSIPLLQLELADPARKSWVEVDACLDTGASHSLFDGQLTVPIGLDLYAGTPLSFMTTSGIRLEALVHRIVLRHDVLGHFELEAAFSTTPISRNLLGRDFMNLVQVGFRENQLSFFVAPRP